MRRKTNRAHRPTPARTPRALLLCAPLLFIFLNSGAATERGGANPDAARATNATRHLDSASYAAAHDDDSPGGAALSSSGAGLSSSQFEGTTGVTEKNREGAAPAVLRDVRAARHPTFDRIVFEFHRGARPGYRVEYAKGPVRRCGSGDDVEVAGSARLLVRLRPAQAHTEAGRPTITRRERRLRLGSLREMKLICDFEADVEWVFGLASRRPYRVLELSNPARLVVDVKR